MDDKAAPNRQASIDRTVEWVDTDASGHQHNSAIMRWVEAAEAELFRGLKLPEYFPIAPRVQQIVNYKSKLWFGQRVTAKVEIQRLGRTSITYGFQVHGHARAGSDGGLAAFGSVTVAHVPAGSATAQPWPANIRAAVHPVESTPESTPEDTPESASQGTPESAGP
ncbi:acyl-CoA thioesterase [Paeniglutamicibacter antarcticus]|uniref:Acyl-CoA thioesterase n=2 Tax=Arthrobacter terrae TaxID=2935737 RepID=A0A931CR35_9MICC|nr:acyl-CoA thioesterase [Arthrobacter terrae]